MLQEIDVRTGLVMYEWTSLDHVGIPESYASPKRSNPGFPYDFFHINSIQIERDGSLLISARNTWAAYKVNHQTGATIWALGGKHSSFRLAPGSGSTSSGHAASRAPTSMGRKTRRSTGGSTPSS